MAIDFTHYQTPGVYAENVGGPQLAVRSSVPTAVAIFGQAVGYRTYRESVRINPDTGDTTTTWVINLVLNGGSGDFTLTFGGQTTEDIADDATAGDVQDALNDLTTLEGVSVAGDPGGPWTVTATNVTGNLTGSAAGITGGTGAVLNIASETVGTPAMNKTLTQKGIKPASVRVVNPNSGLLYAVGTDYVITRVSAGEDGEAETRDDTYTIQRVIDGGRINPGDIVQLSYQYTDPNYFEVYSLYDYDDVRDLYGEPFDAAGNIQSELTLAAKFAFINGASTVLCCAIDPEDPETPGMADYVAALDKFRDESQIAIIVPATGQLSIQDHVLQHVTAQSNNKFERSAIVGMDGSVTPIASSTRIARAQELSSERVALVSPSGFVYAAPELNRDIVLGGQFMAAAIAGRAVSQIAAMPLTHKRILGFSGPAETQREGEKNLEGSEGLMVVEKTRRQQVRIRHGVTTNTTDLHTREWNIIRQADVMVYRVRDYLDADGLIGMPIYDTTIVQVKASAEAALVSLVRDEIIRGYRNLKARQIDTLPDVIEVRYEWRPAYPLNYIVVRYSIAVESGDVATTFEGTTTG